MAGGVRLHPRSADPGVGVWAPERRSSALEYFVGAFPWLFLRFWMRRSWKPQAVERISKRRQALEALRAKLDENSAGS